MRSAKERISGGFMRIFAAVFTITMIYSALCSVSAASGGSSIGSIYGETGRTSHELLMNDGTATGVIHTQVEFDGYYGSEKMLNAVEFDLSDTHLSFDVINCGEYLVSKEKVDSAVGSYNRDGRTVLAAINGDLWMTNVHSSPAVTTEVLAVSRGVMIVDREIWASEQIGMENYAATNAEQGTSSPPKAAFGVTDTNQPLVGSPVITPLIRNQASGKTAIADGINRLPAMNSLIVYNHRVNSMNFALSDAYEVELAADDTAFMIGGKVTATVKGIYPPDSETRPSIGDNTVILTARGNKISLLSAMKVGQSVEITTPVIDRYGNTEPWQRVTDAIGGHLVVSRDGKPEQSLGSGEYPASLIGYNDDGKVIFCSVTSRKNDDGSDSTVYAGLNFSQAYEFCRSLGYNSVFYLDGGGSSTLVTLENGTYTVRNNCSDGSVRPVINAAAVCYNTDAVCEAQGDLSYIQVPPDIGKIDPRYLDGALIAELFSGPHHVNCGTSDDGASAVVRTSVDTNDPYVLLDFSRLQAISAEEYPYLVCRVKTNYPADSSFYMYYGAGADTYPTEARTVFTTLTANGGEAQYAIMDFSSKPDWKGKINFLRLDIFNGMEVSAGYYVDFEAMIFCRNLDEAQAAVGGWIPDGDGIVTDYTAFKNGTYVRHSVEDTSVSEETDTDAAAADLIENVEEAGKIRGMSRKTAALAAVALAVTVTIITAVLESRG